MFNSYVSLPEGIWCIDMVYISANIFSKSLLMENDSLVYIHIQYIGDYHDPYTEIPIESRQRDDKGFGTLIRWSWRNQFPGMRLKPLSRYRLISRFVWQ